ncbi:hypothetical protein B4U78_014965 [Microbacterium esteraromaticum]|nr:hypothetical protein B4U78_014965 [Microbacterium esteraromaticum]
MSETSDQLTPEGFRKGRCTMLRGGHILFIHHAQEKQIKNVTINERELCFTSEIQGLEPQENIGIPFLFYLLKGNIGIILRKSTASTKTETVKKEKLNLYPIKLPPQSLIDKFNSFCKPIFELQKSNEQIIKRLLKLQKGWIESLD